MNSRQTITSPDAPAAIGTYSQAVKVGQTVYLSGQIPLHPETMELVEGGFAAQAEQMFANLQAVCKAAGGNLNSLVKLNFYLTDLSNFAVLNEIMAKHFTQPYPARAAVQVSALPKDSLIEADGIMLAAE